MRTKSKAKHGLFAIIIACVSVALSVQAGQGTLYHMAVSLSPSHCTRLHVTTTRSPNNRAHTHNGLVSSTNACFVRSQYCNGGNLKLARWLWYLIRGGVLESTTDGISGLNCAHPFCFTHHASSYFHCCHAQPRSGGLIENTASLGCKRYNILPHMRCCVHGAA